MKTTWLMIRGVLATMWGMGLCQGQSLTVDLASNPIQLDPNLAGQKVVIWGSYSGPDIEVIGGYLAFQVNGGGNVQNQPSITALDVESGTPWAGSALTLTPDTEGNAQFKGINIFLTDFVVNATVVTITNGPIRLAELTFDTTSLSGGSWTFAMTGRDLVVSGDSHLALSDGGELTLNATLGSVTVVPEPMSATAATGLAAGLAGCWLVRRRRRGA